MEPQWLSADHIVDINKDVVAERAENHTILSLPLLESAATRPQNLYHYEQVEDIVLLGVRLIEAIGKNHCFEQGNKRTALYAGLAFMELNEVQLFIPDAEDHAKLISDVIVGLTDDSELVALLQSRVM